MVTEAPIHIRADARPSRLAVRFAVLRSDSQCCGQQRCLLDGIGPDQVWVRAVIVMREDDAQAGDTAPVDIRVSGNGVLADVAGGLSDDLEQSLSGAQQHLVGRAIGTAQGNHCGQYVARIKDVGDPLVVAAGPTRTASRRM